MQTHVNGVVAKLQRAQEDYQQLHNDGNLAQGSAAYTLLSQTLENYGPKVEAFAKCNKDPALQQQQKKMAAVMNALRKLKVCACDVWCA
jgi:hypothetical protein